MLAELRSGGVLRPWSVVRECGGPGSGRPGPCPEGRPHIGKAATARANATQAKKSLSRAEQAHAKNPTPQTKASLQKARVEHARNERTAKAAEIHARKAEANTVKRDRGGVARKATDTKTAPKPATKQQLSPAKQALVSQRNIKAAYRGYAKQLSTDERGAFAAYAGNSANYRAINSGLRGGNVSVEHQQTVANLNSAIAKGTVPENTVVYRGLSTDLGLKPGDTFQDKAFVSTSLNPSLAGAFSRQGGGGGTVLSITVPKGSHAAYADAVHSNFDQKEMILPAGSKFKVARIETVTPAYPGDKPSTRVHVELVP